MDSKMQQAAAFGNKTMDTSRLGHATAAPYSGLGARPRAQTTSKRLLKNNQNLVALLQLLVDIIIVSGSLCVLTYLQQQAIPSSYRFLAVIAAFCMAFIYSERGIYRCAAGSRQGLLRLTMAWLMVLACLAALGFVTKTSEDYSRQTLLLWTVGAWLAQLVSYLSFSYLTSVYKSGDARSIPTLVIGSGALAQQLTNSLNSNHWVRDKVVGFLSLEGESTATEAAASNTLLGVLSKAYLNKPLVSEQSPLAQQNLQLVSETLIGSKLITNIAALAELVKAHKVKRIYLALPMALSQQVSRLNVELLDLNVDIIWAPDIYALKLMNHSVREVAGVPLISLNESPLTSSRLSTILKDIMDRLVASIALVVLSPLLLLIAAAVKLSSPGPVLFKQQRHGWDGKIIKVWKFRSMKMHTEQQGEIKQASKADDRITAVGKFIRRTSIDELPQLINVLQGRMSLVGPRPHAVAHNHFYSKKINAYLCRHRIKPGITGLAQISGCRGETQTIDKMEKRVEFDLEYINNWSLWLDIKILIKTPFTLLAKDIY